MNARLAIIALLLSAANACDHPPTRGAPDGMYYLTTVHQRACDAAEWTLCEACSSPAEWIRMLAPDVPGRPPFAIGSCLPDSPCDQYLPLGGEDAPHVSHFEKTELDGCRSFQETTWLVPAGPSDPAGLALHRRTLRGPLTADCEVPLDTETAQCTESRRMGRYAGP